jgi:uncharacterized coiled-coil protein SlyX
MEGNNDLLQLVQRKLAEKEGEVLELRERLKKQSGSVNVTELQDQLGERDQVICAQMEQINEMVEQLEAFEKAASEAGAGDQQSEQLVEQEDLIREQMEQILELSDKLEKIENESSSDDLTSSEKDEVIHEQMGQILEFEERIEELEKEFSQLKNSLAE